MKAAVARALRFMGAELAPAAVAGADRRRRGGTHALTARLARPAFRARNLRHQAGAREHLAPLRGARPSGAELHHAARRRHQRQGVGDGHGARGAARRRAADRALHVTAPRRHHRAVRHRRRRRWTPPRFNAVAHEVLDLRRPPAWRDGTLRVLPTFFEATTAIAFELFRRAGVEVAVIEVGLGGRFDATNVITPVAGAITTIGFDHQQHLGHDARAKSPSRRPASSSPACTVVAGALPPSAMEVVRRGGRRTRRDALETAHDSRVTAEMQRGRGSGDHRHPARPLRPADAGAARRSSDWQRRGGRAAARSGGRGRRGRGRGRTSSAA